MKALFLCRREIAKLASGTPAAANEMTREFPGDVVSKSGHVCLQDFLFQFNVVDTRCDGHQQLPNTLRTVIYKRGPAKRTPERDAEDDTRS